jgi:hypothetical protein
MRDAVVVVVVVVVVVIIFGGGFGAAGGTASTSTTATTFGFVIAPDARRTGVSTTRAFDDAMGEWDDVDGDGRHDLRLE